MIEVYLAIIFTGNIFRNMIYNIIQASTWENLEILTSQLSHFTLIFGNVLLIHVRHSAICDVFKLETLLTGGKVLYS